MNRITKKTAVLITAAAVMGAMLGAVQVSANGTDENLFSADNLKTADYNDGTDVAGKFGYLTDGDTENQQTINRSDGTHTYYAVYEVSSEIESISAYYTGSSFGKGAAADILFYGSNDDGLALLTEPPAKDLGWKSDGSDKSGTDFKNTYDLTFLANTASGTATTVSDNTYKKTVSITDDTVYKYVVVLLNGWQNTYVSEIEAIGKKEAEKLTTDEVIWAQDIIDRGGNHQGSSSEANTNEVDTGSFRNTDDVLKIFFPGADDGIASGMNRRINGIDNAGGDWAGYVGADVYAAAGSYTVYILGCTNDENGRSIEATNITTGSVVTSKSSVDLIQYSDSSSDPMYVFEMSGLRLAEGENTIRIQAPSGKSAPNFVAMYITQDKPTEPQPVQMQQVTFSGEFNGETVAEGTKQLTAGDKTFTAWKGRISTAKGVSLGNKLSVTAVVSGSSPQTKAFDCTTLTDADAVFYVIINEVPDEMSFVIE